METGAASELTARSPPTLQTRYWDSKVLLTPLASRSAKPPFPSGGVDQLPPEPCASTVEAVRQSTFPTYSVTSSPALPKIRRQRTPTRRASRARICIPTAAGAPQHRHEVERTAGDRAPVPSPTKLSGTPPIATNRRTMVWIASIYRQSRHIAQNRHQRPCGIFPQTTFAFCSVCEKVPRRAPRSDDPARSTHPPSPTWSPLTLLKPPRPGPRALRDAPATLDKPEP